MPTNKPNRIDSLRGKFDPHYKLSGKVEGLEQGVSDQVSQIHKTLSKSFVMQRKTLVRVLGLEKRVNHLELQQAAEEQAKENLDEILSDIREEESEAEAEAEAEVGGGTKTKVKPKTKKKPKIRAKKRKIKAKDLKKGTPLDEGFASRVLGEDKDGGYLSKEERIARFKGQPLTKPDDLKPSESSDEKKGGVLAEILTGVNSIVETLKGTKKQDKKQQSWLQRMAERFKRRKKENKLEFKVFDGLKKTATKLLAPMKSAWQKLLDFLGKVILGRVLFKILTWMGNKENQGKLQSIIKFFEDWWPTMLAAYLLFGNSLTKFVATMLGRLLIWGGKLIATVIPKLVTALGMMGPKGVKLLAKAGSGALLFSGGGEVEAEPSFESEMGIQMAGGGLVPNFNEGDISVNNFTTNGGLVKHFNEGGLVTSTENIVSETTENVSNVTGGVVASTLTAAAESAAAASDGAAGSDAVAGVDGAAGSDAVAGVDGAAGSDAVVGSEGVADIEEEQDPMVKTDPVELNNKILDSITQFISTLPFKDQIEMVSPSDEAPQEFKKGGFVSGPGGVDKVPARLTAGEFVMSKGAVQKYGVNALAAMNAAGGGTNRPTVSRSRYNGGGLVKQFNEGGLVDNGKVGFFGGIGNIMGGKKWSGESRGQIGRGVSQVNIAPNKTDTVITPSEKKKVTVAYEEEKKKSDAKTKPTKSEQKIPNFDVTASRSPQKIKVLGISV